MMTERPRETISRLPLTLSNIYPGREFATYKEFCKELGLEIKTGGMKIRQMKEIEKILKISTRGWKIRIEEIRDGESLKEIERCEAEERLEKDCEMGRGIFKDRLNLFMIMVWESMMGGKEIPSGGFTDYKHFSDEKKTHKGENLSGFFYCSETRPRPRPRPRPSPSLNPYILPR